MLAEVGDTLTGHLEYCTDLFSADTAARMAGHLRVRPSGPSSSQLHIAGINHNDWQCRHAFSGFLRAPLKEGACLWSKVSHAVWWAHALGERTHNKRAAEPSHLGLNGVRAARQALLDSVLAAPDAPVDSLGFMSQPERDVLLREFNATDLAPTDLLHKGQTLHGLLEHWASATPDATAAVFKVFYLVLLQ